MKQKPQWCFELNNDHLILLQAIISSNYVTIYVDDKIISTFRIFSMYENIFHFELHGQKFSLILHNKPVGGYDYMLKTIEGKKLDPYESNPSVAVSHQAKKVAESSAAETVTRAPWFIIGILGGGAIAAVFGGPLAIFCGIGLGIFYVFIEILILESTLSKFDKILLFIIITVLFVAIDILMGPLFALLGFDAIPRWYP
jgi:hypothetical protein